MFVFILFMRHGYDGLSCAMRKFSVANSLRSKMANVSEKMAKMANRFLLHFYVTISW